MILISGWAGAGKDEVAKFFVTHAGFTRFAFADTLKDDVAEATGLPRTLFERPFKDQPIPSEFLSSSTEPKYLNVLLKELQSKNKNNKENGTPRDLLLLHAAKEREKDPDIYARKTVSNILNNKCKTKSAVISDWRMMREGEFVKGELLGLKESPSWKILHIRVNRPEIPSPIADIDHELDSFPSFDITISNEGTLEDLWETCNSIFRSCIALIEN